MPAGFCEVALPVPLRSTFVYAVPATLESAELIGRRIVVPFRNRAMVGVGLCVTAQKPEVERVREIVELLDPIPALPPRLVELGRWVSSYYVAPVGETFRAMLPPPVEVRHEREFSLTEAGREHLHDLALDGAKKAEIADLAALQLFENGGKPLTGQRLRRLPGGEAAIERLVRLGYLEAREVTHRRKTRAQRIVAWNRPANDAAANAAEGKIRETLIARGPVPLAQLRKLAGVSAAVLARLEKKGVLASWEEPLTAEEDAWETDFTPPSNILNGEQRSALDEIKRWLDAREFTVGLLHGVTGSGKTEVYLGAIDAALAQGRTGLVLVPEIALTLWVSRLVRARFGEGVAVLHSGLPDIERAREWWRVRRGEARVVVGTRSAVFAPLENLGLVIVDEEQ